MEEIMNPIRVIVTQRPIVPEESSEGCHLKVQYGSTETTSRITADGVEELLKINKSIKWYMEEFEDATITQKRPNSVGALRWEVLQNRDLWSAEARPASVSVVRILRADVEEVPVPSTDLDSSSTFNILALTARPNNVNDIPHRLITKSIYDVVAKANGAYALFINEIKREAQLVSAEDLAGLLSSHGVRTVILNACQSAVEGEGPSANLAKALIQNGIETVVAMGYKVLDVTARLFVSSFYDQLLRLNRSPLLAAQAARQCLLNKRTKKTSYLTEVPLDDYLVPSVYIGDGGMNYVDHELSISDLEMLRTSPPELPPDRSVDVDMNLIGREGELLMLEMDLMLESCITAIEGPPGVGKSALINGAAEWWKSTAFIDRVINIGPMAM
ncbi:CHAT domain-containing protein [Xylaria grammica]|nr:CHAT domain-containing protein [Xylaria grammica]